MKILKYLLNYISLFMIVLIVFTLVYFRVEIFPNNINKSIDSGITLLENQFDIDIPQYHHTDNNVEKLSVNESVEDTAEGSESLAVIDKSSDNTEISNNNVKDDEISQSIESAPIVASVPQVIEAPVINPVINDKSAVETSTSNAVVNHVDSSVITLNKARQAYWHGQIKASEDYYIELTKNDNKNPDVYGELGNIYYMQGKWKQAGDAYYEAAIRLIDQKQYAQVNYLLRVIQGLNPNVARKLQKKMLG